MEIEFKSMWYEQIATNKKNRLDGNVFLTLLADNKKDGWEVNVISFDRPKFFHLRN